MSEAESVTNYYKYVLEKILVDARSIRQTGDQEVDSYVDSIIKTASSVLVGGEEIE